MRRVIGVLTGGLLIIGFAFADPTRYCDEGPGGSNIKPAMNLVTIGCIQDDGPNSPGNSGNDVIEAVEGAIQDATGVAPVGLALYYKTDNAGSALVTVTATADPTDEIFNWNAGSTKITYISIKQSTEFALYQFSPATTSGIFSTVGLNGTNDFSHVSFWTTTGAVVPEPNFIFVLVGGIAAMVAARRFSKRTWI